MTKEVARFVADPHAAQPSGRRPVGARSATVVPHEIEQLHHRLCAIGGAHGEFAQPTDRR